jgi:RNA polymerase sigma-70 factor (ECF subfamily)
VEQFRERMLLRRPAARGRAGVAELVKANHDRVFDLVYRMIGDREEALDLSQEVFVAVHAAVGRFRGEARLVDVDFRVAKNHCLNRLKYLAGAGAGALDEISGVPEAVLERNAPSPPDEAVAVSETRTMVHAPSPSWTKNTVFSCVARRRRALVP